MHELYIAECILQSARRALPPEADPGAVERLRVRVGKLDAVVPGSLQFLFDAIKASHDMPRASLEITHQDVHCVCRRCGGECILDEPVFICPLCGNGDMEVRSGRGIYLESITLQD